MARIWSSPRTSVPAVRPGRSGMCAADSAICRSVAGASNAAVKSAAMWIVVVPKSGFAMAACPFQRGLARSRIDAGRAAAARRVVWTSRMGARAAKPVPAPPVALNDAGMPAAFGDTYGSTRPRPIRMNGRTGSPDQKTSARGLCASARSRFNTPVLFVSSVSNTACTATPVCRSKSRKMGSETTWSTDVYGTTSGPPRPQADAARPMRIQHHRVMSRAPGRETFAERAGPPSAERLGTQVIEIGDRIRLGPHTDLPRLRERRVMGVYHLVPVERHHEVVATRLDAELVPRPTRHLPAPSHDLPPAPVLHVIQVHVVLEGVGARQVVVVLVLIAEHETTRLVHSTRYGLAPDRQADVAECRLVRDGDREPIVRTVSVELREYVSGARRVLLRLDDPTPRLPLPGAAEREARRRRVDGVRIETPRLSKRRRSNEHRQRDAMGESLHDCLRISQASPVPPGSLLLRIEGGSDSPRELLSRALSPEVKKHDARLLVRHVVVDRDDVDVRVPQRLEDVLELILEHCEVAIDDSGSLAPRECRPGADPHRLPDLGAVHGCLAPERGLPNPALP